MDISVSLLANNSFINTPGKGPGESFLFDLSESINGTTIKIDNLSAGFSFDPAPANPQDGTGDWKYGILCDACHGGYNPGYTGLDFHVTGITLADFYANNLGNAFALDLCLGYNGDKCLVTGDTVVTLIPTPVPEPLTLSLFGVGLVAMGGFGWRRRKNASAA